MNIKANIQSLLPDQKNGAKTDIVHSLKLSSKSEADHFFKIVKFRLLDVSQWHKRCGLVTASFTIIDEFCNVAKRNIQQNDYIRIDIPGPGSIGGHGYDWVKVENIESKKDIKNDIEFVAIKVRPAKDPNVVHNETEHFFREKATSTFMVIRENDKVRAEIHGRNELPNVKQGRKFDTIRNTLIALGAIAGLSKWQWKKLVRGLVSVSSK